MFPNARIPYGTWGSSYFPAWQTSALAEVNIGQFAAEAMNRMADQLNRRWWHYVEQYQGVAPPGPRGEGFCDAATKTHINDNPAQYYKYAIAFAIKWQLHMHIAKNILHQDPHNLNCYGNREVGEFLLQIMRPGATKDWQTLLKETTGEELSARPMLDYFEPLMGWLKEQNQGRQVGW